MRGAEGYVGSSFDGCGKYPTPTRSALPPFGVGTRGYARSYQPDSSTERCQIWRPPGGDPQPNPRPRGSQGRECRERVASAVRRGHRLAANATSYAQTSRWVRRALPVRGSGRVEYRSIVASDLQEQATGPALHGQLCPVPPPRQGGRWRQCGPSPLSRCCRLRPIK